MKKEIKDYLHLENWKIIKGYGREYSISSIGRIKGQRRASFGSTSNYGYKRACLWAGEKFVFVMIHRLVAEAFIPNPENKPHVNHKNGVKSDNGISNLEWVTVSENAKHAYATSLRKAHPVLGEKHYASKLTELKVKEIRNSNLSQKKLSVQYGVSPSVVGRIKEKKSWKHVI